MAQPQVNHQLREARAAWFAYMTTLVGNGKADKDILFSKLLVSISSLTHPENLAFNAWAASVVSDLQDLLTRRCTE